MKKKHAGGLGFVVLLSLITALPPLATDMALPAVLPIAADLAVAPASVGLALSSFMAGFAVGPLVFGPLSDRHGRKPTLGAALLVYMAAGLACAAAGSLGALIGWRFVQGFGAGASWPIALAVVRDVYAGDDARAKMSWVNAMSMVAPLIAPSLGAVAIALAGWRTIYLVLAGAGTLVLLLVLLFQPETNPSRGGAPGTAGGVLAAYARVLRDPLCAGCALVNALGFGALFSYITGSPLVLMQVLSLSAAEYGLAFVVSTAGILSGTLVNGAASSRGVRAGLLIAVGTWLQLATAGIFTAASAAGAAPAPVVAGLAAVHLFGFGLVAPNVAQIALRPIPDIAGTGAAVLTALQLATGAVFGALVSALHDDRTALSTAGMMLVGSAASFIAWRRLARRLSADATG